LASPAAAFGTATDAVMTASAAVRTAVKSDISCSQPAKQSLSQLLQSATSQQSPWALGQHEKLLLQYVAYREKGGLEANRKRG
jgi:hypothetical protein